MAELTGQTLGQYQIGERIGRGGMASVYRARQLSMDRDVAIKVMSAELSDSDEFLTRFEREAHVIARLQHPHILPVIDFGRSGDAVYLVMRFVEGGTLSERLRRGPLTLRQIDRVAEQIASALEYAHLRGVIHRDLKTNNVLLDEIDNAYLTDFGIAKMLAGATDANLTSTGAVMGTPAYMAPEQWRSEPVDARTDIYALGVILYELLLGAQPFQAETPFGMMFKHVDAPPPRPRLVNPALPEHVERVLLCALAKSPGERYAAASDLSRDFHAGLETLAPALLDAPLPRASADEIARFAPPTPPPQPAPSAAPASEMTTPAPVLSPPRPSVPAGMAAPAAISPPPAGPPGSTGFPPVHPQRASRPKRRRGIRGWMIGGAALLLLLIALGGAGLIYLLLNGDDDPPPAVAERGANETPIATLLRTDSGDGTARAAAIVLTQTAAYRPPATGSTTPAPSDPAPSGTPPPTNTSLPRESPSPTPITPPAGLAVCGALPSRLTLAEGARTTLLPAVNTTVRDAPGLTSIALRQIPPGQVFQVIDGPSCADAIAWWQIQGVSSDGAWTGWIGEGRDDTYWLEPFPVGLPRCAGDSTPPRLSPGGRGRVTLEPPLPSRVRAAPTVGGDYLGQLQPGQSFDVISGPVCDDADRWWWLISGHGLEGWMAEGEDGAYFLEPIA